GRAEQGRRAMDRRQPPPGLSPQAQAAVRQRRAGRRHAEVRDSQGDADRLKIAIVRSRTSLIRARPAWKIASRVFHPAASRTPYRAGAIRRMEPATGTGMARPTMAFSRQQGKLTFPPGRRVAAPG